MPSLSRPRLLPVLTAGMGLLLAVKLGAAGLALVAALDGARLSVVGPAQAESAPEHQPASAHPAPPPAAPGHASAPPAAQHGAPAAASATRNATPAVTPGAAAGASAAGDCAVSPVDAAERAVLEQLRSRRAEIEKREQQVAERAVLLAAAERRLSERVDSLAALQARLETAEKARGERDEAGWRQMVKLYEGMRPRDAAAIFDDLDMPVLVEILARMNERKASPVLGAMRPERARQITAVLARHRAAPPIN